MSIMSILGGLAAAATVAGSAGQVQASRSQARLEEENARLAQQESKAIQEESARQKSFLEIETTRTTGVLSEEAKRASEFIGKEAKHEASLAIQKGGAEAEGIRKTATRNVGTQQAQFAKAGVTTEGSPMLVLAETFRESETAALRATFAGEEESRRILASSAEERRQLTKGTEEQKRAIIESTKEKKRQITAETERKKEILASEAEQARFRARQGRRAGFIGAGTTLLTGADKTIRAIRGRE